MQTRRPLNDEWFVSIIVADGMLEGLLGDLLDTTSDGELDALGSRDGIMGVIEYTEFDCFDDTAEGISDGSLESLFDGTLEDTLEGILVGTSDGEFDDLFDGVDDKLEYWMAHLIVRLRICT